MTERREAFSDKRRLTRPNLDSRKGEKRSSYSNVFSNCVAHSGVDLCKKKEVYSSTSSYSSPGAVAAKGDSEIAGTPDQPPPRLSIPAIVGRRNENANWIDGGSDLFSQGFVKNTFVDFSPSNSPPNNIQGFSPENGFSLEELPEWFTPTNSDNNKGDGANALLQQLIQQQETPTSYPMRSKSFEVRGPSLSPTNARLNQIHSFFYKLDPAQSQQQNSNSESIIIDEHQSSSSLFIQSTHHHQQPPPPAPIVFSFRQKSQNLRLDGISPSSRSVVMSSTCSNLLLHPDAASSPLAGTNSPSADIFGNPLVCSRKKRSAFLPSSSAPQISAGSTSCGSGSGNSSNSAASSGLRLSLLPNTSITSISDTCCCGPPPGFSPHSKTPPTAVEFGVESSCNEELLNSDHNNTSSSISLSGASMQLKHLVNDSFSPLNLGVSPSWRVYGGSPLERETNQLLYECFSGTAIGLNVNNNTSAANIISGGSPRQLVATSYPSCCSMMTMAGGLSPSPRFSVTGDDREISADKTKSKSRFGLPPMPQGSCYGTSPKTAIPTLLGDSTKIKEGIVTRQSSSSSSSSSSCQISSSSSAVFSGKAGQCSLGSVNHPASCRPCTFFWSGRGCIKGSRCAFCHMKHIVKKRKAVKEQRNLMIISRPDGKIEYLRCSIEEAIQACRMQL